MRTLEIKQSKDWIIRHRIIIFLGLFAGIYFVYTYFLQLPRPGALSDPKASWNYWFDQGQYLIEAKAIHVGNINKSQYTYPLGYPMIAAAFIGLYQNDPFLIFNLAVFVFVIVMFYIILANLFDKCWAIVGSGALLLATPLAYYTVIPWTTTATLPLVMILMYLAFSKTELTFFTCVVASFTAVLAYMARGGGEVVLLTPLFVAILWKYKSTQDSLVKGLLFAGIFMAGVGLNALWTHAIFGVWLHPYLKIVAQIGFNPRRIPRSFWGTVIFSGRAGMYYPPLLASTFWFILAPLGMIMALRNRSTWYLHLGLITSMALGFMVTTSYNEYSAATLRYNSLHYLKIWFPALALYAIFSLATALKGQAVGEE